MAFYEGERDPPLLAREAQPFQRKGVPVIPLPLVLPLTLPQRALFRQARHPGCSVAFRSPAVPR